MGNASSKAKTNPVVTSQDEAVLKMKIQRDNLEKYQALQAEYKEKDRQFKKRALWSCQV